MTKESVDVKYKDGNYDPKLFNTKAAEEIVPHILSLFNASNVVDIGCGVGTWLSVFANQGLNVKGVDGTVAEARSNFLAEENFILHDLTKPLEFDKKFDLAISFEVAEHLPESAAETFVDTMTSASDQIVFSAAIPFQTNGHINEQWPSYWIEKFEARGYKALDLLRPMIWNNKLVDTYYKQNAVVFVRNEKSLTNQIHNHYTPLDLVHPDQYYHNMELLRNDLNMYQSGAIGVQGSLKLLFKALSEKLGVKG